MGQLYYQGGRGVAVDYDLAFYYFMQASTGGDPIADAYIGRMYAEGVGNIEQSYETAFEYFSKSAEQVLTRSHDLLSNVCVYFKSVRWYMRLYVCIVELAFASLRETGNC